MAGLEHFRMLGLVAFLLMILPPLIRRKASLGVWFLKSAILYMYLFGVCVYIFHEGGHVFIYVISGVEFTYHFDRISPYIAVENPPASVRLISLIMAPVFQAILGYLFLFSDWKVLEKFREGFIDKNAVNVFLFLILVIVNSVLDILGIVAMLTSS